MCSHSLICRDDGGDSWGGDSGLEEVALVAGAAAVGARGDAAAAAAYDERLMRQFRAHEA